MHTHLFCMGLAGMLAFGTQPTAPVRRDQQAVVVTGRVVEIHAARLFTLSEARDGRELLILAPRPISPAVVGATVKVEGTFQPVHTARLKQQAGSSDMDERAWTRFAGRQVLIASSVLAAREGELPAGTAPEAEEVQRPRPATASGWTAPAAPLRISATALVSYLEGLAGQRVRITSARVVGVLEPGAFLIEPATRDLKPMGLRDRLVVLIEGNVLRVTPDMLVGSVVNVEGVARTTLGVQVTGERPWPARLDPRTVERLEVRGAVLASSVQTAEGTELTGRP